MARFLSNNLAYKSFLSSVAKDIEEYDGIYSWRIYKNIQVAFTRPIVEKDLVYLNKFNIFSSYYLTVNDISILNSVYSISKSKDNDIVIPVENFSLDSLSGRKYSDIRHAMNRNIKKNFRICNNFDKIEDILVFLDRWDDTSGEKYFQSRAGKNRYFFRNNFHLEGHSLFIYDNDKIIAFGVLSKVDVDGYSSYVIGKSLCHDYSGISEYADVLIFLIAKDNGIKMVNMGGGVSAVVNYKKKFPNYFELENYDIRAKKK